MQSVTRPVQVAWTLCHVQVGQGGSDTSHVGGVQITRIASFIESS